MPFLDIQCKFPEGCDPTAHPCDYGFETPLRPSWASTYWSTATGHPKRHEGYPKSINPYCRGGIIYYYYNVALRAVLLLLPGFPVASRSNIRREDGICSAKQGFSPASPSHLPQSPVASCHPKGPTMPSFIACLLDDWIALTALTNSRPPQCSQVVARRRRRVLCL